MSFVFVYRIYDIIEENDVFALWVLHVIFSPLAGMHMTLYSEICYETIHIPTGALVAIVMYGVERNAIKQYSLSSIKVS